MKKFTYVIAPEGCPDYLTAGKRYDVIDIDVCDDIKIFGIKSDEGILIYCIPEKCAHLYENGWIIPELEND